MRRELGPVGAWTDTWLFGCGLQGCSLGGRWEERKCDGGDTPPPPGTSCQNHTVLSKLPITFCPPVPRLRPSPDFPSNLLSAVFYSCDLNVSYNW